MGTTRPVIDEFDRECLGDLYPILERLYIGGMLIDDGVNELEWIMRSSPWIDRQRPFG